MSHRFLTIANLMAHPQYVDEFAPYTVESMRRNPSVQKAANASDLVMRYARIDAQNSGNKLLLEWIQIAKEIMGSES
ncbi:MAG: hypothetical protein JXA38_00665 [Methanosarcinaceae archaeon]|nr:hypothetical protein [Methanosarcinaceae archaeon]